MERNSLRLKNKSLNGFTLLECLLALFVLSCSCSLFSLCIRQGEKSNQQLLKKEAKLWQLFLIQLENESEDLILQKVSATEITCLKQKNHHQVIFQLNQDKIVKRENGGYQPLLTGIRQAVFKAVDQVVEITVTFPKGARFTARWQLSKEELP